MLGGLAGSALPIEEGHGMHGFLTDAVPCLSIHVLLSLTGTETLFGGLQPNSTKKREGDVVPNTTRVNPKQLDSAIYIVYQRVNWLSSWRGE